MDENTNPVEPVAEEVAEQPVAEVQAEEADAVAEEVPAAEEEAAPVVEEVPAEEAAAEEPNPLAAAFQQLSLAIAALTDKVDGLVAQREAPAPKADAESAASEPEPEAEAKGIGGEDDRVAQLEKMVQDLTAQVTALSTPVERKGALPVEDAAGDEAAEDEQPEAAQKPKSLNEAVGMYMKGRSARR